MTIMMTMVVMMVMHVINDSHIHRLNNFFNLCSTVFLEGVRRVESGDGATTFGSWSSRCLFTTDGTIRFSMHLMPSASVASVRNTLMSRQSVLWNSSSRMKLIFFW